MVAVVAACGAARGLPKGPPPEYEIEDASVSSAIDASVADATDSAPQELARWITTTDDAGATHYTRTPGAHGPPLVVRGVVRPANPRETIFVGCGATPPAGARFGATPIRLTIPPGSQLHVWLRASGPVGLVANRCTRGAHDELVIDGTEGDVTLDVVDLDRVGVRRGQTSPYLVLVEDEGTEPKSVDLPREPPQPGDVTVRWLLTRTKCPAGIEYWTCQRASLQLGGAFSLVVPLTRPLLGQSGCWPDGIGIYCAGASGSSALSVVQARDGTVTIESVSESDGYCPADEYPNGCGSRAPMAKPFKVPPGLRLVPDPDGTFPPP